LKDEFKKQKLIKVELYILLVSRTAFQSKVPKMTSRQFYIYTCICFCFTTQSNASPTNHCEIDPGISNLANKNQLLMFGELHGTNEMPKYFADVVCALSTKNRPIKVGIEHPSAQLPLLEQYINSAGTEEDRLALINNSYWASEHQDGRTSQAMFDLVDRIRQMRKLGACPRIEVVTRNSWFESVFSLI